MCMVFDTVGTGMTLVPCVCRLLVNLRGGTLYLFLSYRRKYFLWKPAPLSDSSTQINLFYTVISGGVGKLLQRVLQIIINLNYFTSN